MKKLILILSCASYLFPQMAASETILPSLQCRPYFENQDGAALQKKNILKISEKTRAFASKLTKTAETSLSKMKILKENSTGYAVLLTLMTVAFAFNSYMATQVLVGSPVLANMYNQFSFVAILIVAAITNEFTADIIKSSYKILKIFSPHKTQNPDESLRQKFTTIQTSLSVNEQMSRNVILAALLQMRINLQPAYEAFRDGKYHYAISQIAMMAVLLNKLFPEIHPQDSKIQAAFKTIVDWDTNKNPDLKADILIKISVLDPDSNQPAIQLYYETLLQSWFD